LQVQSTLTKGKDYIGVGVGAVFFTNDQILLLKRLTAPEIGFWAIQGGSVEFGETIEAAIHREVWEELGVESEIITLLGVTNHILPDEGQHWVAPVFLMQITAGTPQNMEPHKHEDLQWLPLTALPQPLTLTTRCAIEFLKDYLAHP
jgi:8-oxo-dGTP diphosphatase